MMKLINTMFIAGVLASGTFAADFVPYKVT